MGKIRVLIIGIFAVALIDSIDAKQLRVPGVPSPQPYGRVNLQPASEKTVTVVRPELKTVDKNVIKQKLDALLFLPVDNRWDDGVNLLFDLADVDREAARVYFRKMREKIASSVVKPLEGAIEKPSDEPTKIATNIPVSPMKKSEGHPSPPSFSGMQKGTPPPPPGPKKLMEKGTPPPPPGPKGAAVKPGVVVKKVGAPIVKGLEPLSVKESYSAARLDRESDAAIEKLFEELLVALALPGTFWDSKAPGNPSLDWQNKMGAVKKALLKRPGEKKDYDKIIADRIVAVRNNKKAEAQARLLEKEKQAEDLKPEQDLTEQELHSMIVALFRQKDPSNLQWQIKIQGAIKKLYNVNPEEALKYEKTYLDITKEKKGFIKSPVTQKVVEQPKALTEEDKLINEIDTLFASGVKGPFLYLPAKRIIEELNPLNHKKAVEYHNKLINITGEKPFLRP